MSGSLLSVSIGNQHLTANIVDFGASLAELRLAGCKNSLVLGYPDIQRYAIDGQYMGAVIGRYANRIAGAKAKLGSRTLDLDFNEAGVGHLHGGVRGFGVRQWSLVEATDTTAVFDLQSRDGDMGYPGAMHVVVSYQICEPATLVLNVTAESDADTLVNICHHPYFNLDGCDSIANHRLRIHTDHYLPVDPSLIPRGDIEPVENTEFDFLEMREIGPGSRYNNTYCLHTQQSGRLAKAASVMAGKCVMELWTTQPGLHLYDSNKLNFTAGGHDGKTYQARSGLCLEAQAWPNSPSNANFPNTVLRKGSVYTQSTEYRFVSLGTPCSR